MNALRRRTLRRIRENKERRQRPMLASGHLANAVPRRYNAGVGLQCRLRAASATQAAGIGPLVSVVRRFRARDVRCGKSRSPDGRRCQIKGGNGC